MVSNRFAAIASFSLVPTPSVDATKIGSLNPAAFRSNSPPNPPREASAPGRAVARAAGAMRSTSASPASISTPALLYVIGELREFIAAIPGLAVAAAKSGVKSRCAASSAAHLQRLLSRHAGAHQPG